MFNNNYFTLNFKKDRCDLGTVGVNYKWVTVIDVLILNLMIVHPLYTKNDFEYGNGMPIQEIPYYIKLPWIIN